MSRVYFATNRNPNRVKDPDAFGGKFNPASVDSLRFGYAEAVQRGDKVEMGTIQVAPERLREETEKSQLGSRQLFADLMKSMRDGTDTLVFIHGYNVSFKEALQTGGQLVFTYGALRPLNVVVFSWPSDGEMTPFLAYKRDRTDAAASAPAFARGLLKLRDFLQEVRRGQECKAKIHLMAHSMGNYVLRNGIQEARRHGGTTKLFDQIFLMAADEDHDAFEFDYKLGPLPELGAAVNVYFNRGDTALVVSDRTKSNPTRLGSEGPRLPLNVPGNVTLVDVSEVVEGLVEHSYFWNDVKTVRDVGHVLAGTPHDRVPNRRYVASQNRYVLG